ncbi:MAG: hypothetical protein ACR2KG_11035 [Nocardioidaceae bacterium]
MGKTLVVIAALLVGLTACGGTTAAKNVRQAAPPVNAKAMADYKTCARQMTPLLTKLKDLDSRLGVGMQQADYNTAVGDAKVAYDQITPGAVPADCTSQVWTALESALNRYINADNVWSNCIQDTYCTMDTDATPKMQAAWSKAKASIQTATTNLGFLKVGAQG